MSTGLVSILPIPRHRVRGWRTLAIERVSRCYAFAGSTLMMNNEWRVAWPALGTALENES